MGSSKANKTIQILKDIWRNYLILPDNVTENNFVQRVAYSMFIEGFANKNGDLIIGNLKEFLDIYKPFFRESFLGILSKEAANTYEAYITFGTGNCKLGYVDSFELNIANLN